MNDDTYYYGMLVERLWLDVFNILEHPLLLKKVEPDMDPYKWLEHVDKVLVHPDNLWILAAESLINITYDEIRSEVDKRIHGFRKFLHEEWN